MWTPASRALIYGKQLAAVCRIKALWRLRCCALPVCGFGEDAEISTPVPSAPGFPEFGRQQHEAAQLDGKQLVAVCRINPLWRPRCCALAVCGFGEQGA